MGGELTDSGEEAESIRKCQKTLIILHRYSICCASVDYSGGKHTCWCMDASCKSASDQIELTFPKMRLSETADRQQTVIHKYIHVFYSQRRLYKHVSKHVTPAVLFGSGKAAFTGADTQNTNTRGSQKPQINC